MFMTLHDQYLHNPPHVQYWDSLQQMFPKNVAPKEHDDSLMEAVLSVNVYNEGRVTSFTMGCP